MALCLAALAARGPALAAPAPDPRGVRLEAVSWRLLPRTAGRGAAWTEVRSADVAGSKLPGRIRAVATLVNGGSPAVLGLVLRYVVSLRYALPGGGFEDVPFYLDERHIPSIKTGETSRLSLAVPNVGSNLRDSAGPDMPAPVSIHLRAVLKPRADLADKLQSVAADLNLRYSK